MAEIAYALEPGLAAAEFVAVLRSSGLAERRPVDDLARVAAMLANASLIVTARAGGSLVGVSRALTDFAYACYLSDLAVDRAFQGQGIGQALIARTRQAAGDQSMCLLLAAPAAASFYDRIGMPPAERAYMYPRER